MAVQANSKKRARSDLHSPPLNGTTPATMPVRAAQDEALKSLALVDFLADDARPTFILDISDAEGSSIAYRNPALERLLGDTLNPVEFGDWAVTLKPGTNSTSHGGRAWNCLQQQQIYLVVSANKDLSSAQRTLVTQTAPHPVTRTHSDKSTSNITVNSTSNSTVSSDSRRYSVASSSWKTVSEDGVRHLDWTQYPSSSISAHMHFVRNFSWQETPLGSITTWPDALRQNVLSCMANPDPRLLLWGEERIMIYNEPCISMFGARHPRAMGSRAEDTWSDIWSDMRHLIKYVEVEGRGTRLNKLPLTMERNGYSEETFWSFNLIPVIGSHGHTIGIVDEFSEVTDQVVIDRRRDAVVKINRAIGKVSSMKELWFEFLEGLEYCKDDVPYALLHTIPNAGGPSAPDSSSNSSGSGPQRYSLEGSIGLANGHPAVPLTFDLMDGATNGGSLVRACYKAWQSGDVVVLQAKDDTLPEHMAVGVPGRALGYKVQTVCVIPLPDISGNQTMAFLTLALTPRRPYDSEAAIFAYYMRDILVKSASAIFLPEEQRRARQKFEQIENSLAQQLRDTTLETERLESRYARMAQMAPIAM